MNQVPTKRGVRLLERLGGAMVILAAAAMVTAVACDTGTSSSSGPSWTSMLDDPQSGGTIGVIHFVIEALDQDMSQHTGSVTVAPDGVDLASILEGGGTVTIEFDDFKPATPTGFPESLDGFKLDGEITVGVSIGDGEESLTLSGSLATATSVQNISFRDAQLIFTKLPLGDHDEEPRSAEGEVKFGEDGSWHEMSGIVNALLAVSTSGRIIGDVLVEYAGDFMNPEGPDPPEGVSVTWIDEDSHSVRVTLTDYSPGGGDVTLKGDFDVTITPGTEGNPPEKIVLRGELSTENHTLGSISFDGSSGGLTLSDISDEGGIPGDAQGWVIIDSRRYNAEDLFSFGRFLEAMGIMGGD